MSTVDASLIRELKLNILAMLATESNVPTILKEFRVYIKHDDKAFVKNTIGALGRVANNIPEVSFAAAAAPAPAPPAAFQLDDQRGNGGRRSPEWKRTHAHRAHQAYHATHTLLCTPNVPCVHCPHRLQSSRLLRAVLW